MPEHQLVEENLNIAKRCILTHSDFSECTQTLINTLKVDFSISSESWVCFLAFRYRSLHQQEKTNKCTRIEILYTSFFD